MKREAQDTRHMLSGKGKCGFSPRKLTLHSCGASTPTPARAAFFNTRSLRPDPGGEPGARVSGKSQLSAPRRS